MALLRKETIIEPAKEALYSDIEEFHVHVFGKFLMITVAHGNLDKEGKFVKMASETIEIKDVPDVVRDVEETLTVRDGEITLTYDPVEVPTLKNGEDFLADAAYTVKGKVVAPAGIADGTKLSAVYQRLDTSGREFSALAMTLCDGTKTFYDNLKAVLWDAMIVRNWVEGTIV